MLECRWTGCNKSNDNHQRSFGDVNELTEHIHKVHVGRGKTAYYCRWESCQLVGGKGFKNRYKMCLHLRKHTGEKPYECQFPACNRVFSRSDTFKLHWETHREEGPKYPCPVSGCERKYYQRGGLRKHLGWHGVVHDDGGFESGEDEDNHQSSNHQYHESSNHQSSKIESSNHQSSNHQPSDHHSSNHQSSNLQYSSSSSARSSSPAPSILSTFASPSATPTFANQAPLQSMRSQEGGISSRIDQKDCECSSCHSALQRIMQDFRSFIAN